MLGICTVGYAETFSRKSVAFLAGGAVQHVLAVLAGVRAVAALAVGGGKGGLRTEAVVHAAGNVKEVVGEARETAVLGAALTRGAGLVTRAAFATGYVAE
jgi:hypothetical protein